MSLKGSTNAEKIWNFFKSKGFNDYGCAGMLYLAFRLQLVGAFTECGQHYQLLECQQQR